MRIAIYARYSSDNQRDASIEDQIRLCQEKADREGWTVAQCYTDHSISGASLMRPGIQALMQDAQAGRLDMVLAESLDRLSRDQEDIAGVYKRLSFASIRMVTLSEGPISELHIGLKGTMGALYLKDLADKTRRGLSGRVHQGKSGGGNSFGYDVVRKTGADGEPEHGERVVNGSEAEIVRRIFREYAAGHSPRAIVHRLNKEDVPGPRGKQWTPSTIYGNRRRGTGLINNELYIGRLVWNRQRFMKDPDTGKRVARLNPESEWIVKDVPELRIVDDALWQSVKDRQKDLDAHNPEFHQKQRPRYLFSYLLKCGSCGGGFGKVSDTRLGCSTARNKGTCENRKTIRREKVEATVLNALQEHLMDPELCEAFCEEYTRHMNEIRMQHNASITRYRSELEKLQREKDKLIQSIKDGVPGHVVKDDLIRVENRKDELEVLLADSQEAPSLIHPSMAHRYHQEVRNLIGAMNNGDSRTEAAELLRTLIEKIVLTPVEGEDRLRIDLHGDLAGILQMATRTGNPQESADVPVEQVKMVAGVGFEPTTFRL